VFRVENMGNGDRSGSNSQLHGRKNGGEVVMRWSSTSKHLMIVLDEKNRSSTLVSWNNSYPLNNWHIDTLKKISFQNELPILWDGIFWLEFRVELFKVCTLSRIHWLILCFERMQWWVSICNFLPSIYTHDRVNILWTSLTLCIIYISRILFKLASYDVDSPVLYDL